MVFDDFKNKYEHEKVEEYPNQVPSNPIVSVCVLTYQHGPYIKDCLDSILSQETNFPFEILIGEDESTDDTRSICIAYAKENPDKIKLFLHHRKNNIKIGGQPTATFNVLYNLFMASGKYFAVCEGDDYWTDNKKLQKQVDFLEANQDCSLAYHAAKTIYADHSKPDRIVRPPKIKKTTKFDLMDFLTTLSSLNITTASMVFRRITIKEDTYHFILNAPYGDLCFKLLSGLEGKYVFLDGAPMSLHQRVIPGSWSSKMHSKAWNLKRINNRYVQFELFNQYTQYKYSDVIQKANNKKVAKIIYDMRQYCSKSELVKILLQNKSALPHFVRMLLAKKK